MELQPKPLPPAVQSLAGGPTVADAEKMESVFASGGIVCGAIHVGFNILGPTVGCAILQGYGFPIAACVPLAKFGGAALYGALCE